MKRFAAHRIFISPQEVYSLHYVELDDQSYLKGIYPLEKEVAGTAFYNGTLFLSNEREFNPEKQPVNRDEPVYIFHSESADCSPEKLIRLSELIR